MNRLIPSIGILGGTLAVAGLLAYTLAPEKLWLVTVCESLALVCLISYFVVHFETLKAFSTRRSTRLGLNSFLIVLLFTGATLGGVTWGVLLEVDALGRTLGMPTDHPFFERLAQLRVAAAAALLATLAGVIALAVYGGLVRTRRIAGPILALRHQLERADRGERDVQVRLRRGDCFAELQQSFNRAMLARH